MTFSHTQISQYLRCPRSYRYRYRYLDGWREKETKASLLFGRCFERALSAYFRHEDSTAVLFAEWGAYRDANLEHNKGDSWDRMAIRVFIYWKCLPAMTASGFASRARIFRSKSLAPCLMTTTSWPTSMPWAIWTRPIT